MSRSYKKPYATYVCYFSNKKDKRIANKTFRRRSKIFLKHNLDKLPYRIREARNVWDFASDGLAYYVGNSRLALSQDPADKELFRKWIQK